MKKKSLIHKTLVQFMICTAVIFALMTPAFYMLTKHFYAEDLIDVIRAVERGQAIPQLDLERDIMVGVMIQFVLTFVLLSIALFITVRYITRRLWRPFDDTLRDAERFNLAQSDVPKFSPTDITEFSRLNETLGKLMRKNKETYTIQKEFTENASHELQTPLAVTRSKLDLLMQEKLSQSQLELVEELYRLNTRMGRLNRNLLLLAKIENAQYGDRKPIALTPFIEKLLPSYKLLKGNCSVVMINETDVTINANPVLLESMVNNLVVNAIRHTESGEILIRVVQSNMEISNPAGGTPLNPGEIFRRFHSADAQSGGTGLGLPIVKAICDFHGWHISYRHHDSRHHFTVTL